MTTATSTVVVVDTVEWLFMSLMYRSPSLLPSLLSPHLSSSPLSLPPLPLCQSVSPPPFSPSSQVALPLCQFPPPPLFLFNCSPSSVSLTSSLSVSPLSPSSSTSVSFPLNQIESLISLLTFRSFFKSMYPLQTL